MSKVIYLLLAYLITIFGGDPIVRKICLKLRLPKEKKEGLQGAGKYIGYFERFLALSALLLGKYEVIGFIFAAKSIFRFSLQEEIDYYLVGTFASLSWAVFWGIILGHFKVFL